MTPLPCPSIFDTAPDIMAMHGLRAVRPLKPNTLARVARVVKRYVLDAGNSFLVSLKGTDRRDMPLHQPHPTILAGGGHSALIAPSITRFNGGATGWALRDPAPTVLAKGGPLGLVAPILTYAQHGGAVRDVRDPTHTIAASRKDQNGLIAPFFAKYYGTGDGSRADDPLHTITVKDRMAHVQADLAPPSFGPEHHARARAVAEFLRIHSAWDGGEFVTLTIADVDYVMTDIGMRMLTPRELFNAQGFPPDYVIEGVWLENGSDWQWKPFAKSVQVSCCGNSVCPDLACAIITANCQHMIQERMAA